MMRDVDDLIDEALDREQQDLLARIGPDPSFFNLVFGMFRGPLGWVNGVLTAAQTLCFVAGVYAAFRFFGATDPVVQLRWGLPGAVLIVLSAMIKLAMWPGMYADRTIRELKRLEMAMLRAGQIGAS